METLIWLLLVEGLWLVAFPITFLLFRWLPDRGFAFSLISGLLLGAYAVWLGVNFGLPFNPLTTWLVSLAVFVGLNGWLFWRRKGALRRQLWAYCRSRWRLMLLEQTVFLLFFFLLFIVRGYLPEIRGIEKFANYAFYNGVLHSTTLPPPDLWFSGFTVNYYYFTHFMMAYLTHLTGVAPYFVYNLFLYTIYAMLAVGSFGLGYSMISGRRAKKVALVLGLLATLFVCLVGNLDTMRQLARPGERDLGLCSGVADNSQCFWWSPTRVIYDVRPVINAQGVEEILATETINEFPAFSFLLGDVHPHLVAYPFLVLGLALALNLWRSPRILLDQPAKVKMTYLGFIALLLGGTYFLNTWNYPTAFLIIATALLWQEWCKGRIYWRRLALYLVGLVGVSLTLYAPFLLTFRPFSGQPDIPPALDYPLLSAIGRNVGLVTWDRTPLGQHFLIFGLFDFGLISLLVILLRPYFKSGPLNPPLQRRRLSRLALYLLATGLLALVGNQLLFNLRLVNLLLSLSLGLLALGLSGGGVFLVAHAAMPVGYQRAKQAILLSGWIGLTLVGFALKTETLGLLLITLTTCGLLIFYGRPPRQTSGTTFCLLLTFYAAFILLPLELFYLRDMFESRGNSIFKYYVQIWVLLSLAAAYGIVQVALAARRFKPGYRVLWLVEALLLIAFSLFYPVIGSMARTYLFAEYQGLNGELWLQREYPADYAAILWLRQQAERDPAFRAPILEVAGAYFSEAARVSTFSGFPTLMGWADVHEKIWRIYDPLLEIEVAHRFDLAHSYLYSTDDLAETERILKSYNIKYVFVGALERSLKGEGVTETQLHKFAKFMRVVYDKDNVQIYAFP
ncbi:MAG: hypothetical protein HXX20_22465 [Chloroflexi bacterium]|nr:hypothetical protein [Chloroflexota bacterium]